MGYKGATVAALIALGTLTGLPANAAPAPALHGDTIMLPNLDDDSRRCRVQAADLDAVGGEVDRRLAACHDAADEVVNGRADEKDLARLDVRGTPGLSDQATGRLTVDPPAYARVFVRRTGWQVADTLTTAELRRGVRLGVEGRDLVRDRNRWDGTVTVTLTVTDRGKETRAEHQLRVAPLLLQHDLQRATTMVAGAPGDGPGVPDGFVGLHDARDWDRFRGDLDRAAARTGTDTRYLPGTGTWWHDVWWQDLFEPATASMPTRHGVQTMRFAIRSGNIWDVPAGDGTDIRTPRPAARLAFRDLRGPDVAVVQELSDDGRDGLVDLRNATGNIESLPPYRGYPQGRLVYGSALDGSPAPQLKPDPAFIELLTSQGRQPPVVIDTSWLFVGHADEIVHVVRANNARGWTLAVADPRLAEQLLLDAQARGAGAERLFAGTDAEHQPSVDELLTDPEFRTGNEKTAKRMDDQVAILLRETGLRAGELVRLPVLFQAHPQFPLAVALTPNVVNGLSLSASTFAAPDPHGPVVRVNGAGRDIFRDVTETALRRNGVRVHWVEDLNWAHFGGGEVHCTTNAWRDTSGMAPWWTVKG